MVKSKPTENTLSNVNNVPSMGTISSTASQSELQVSAPTPVRVKKTHATSTDISESMQAFVETQTPEKQVEKPAERKIEVKHVEATIEKPAEDKHAKFVDVPKAKIEATVSIEDAPEQVMKRSKAVHDMNADTSVVIDNKETYFERITREQNERLANEPKDESFHVNMNPEIVDETNEISERFAEKKTNGKWEATVVPTEQVKSASELEKGMCQYYVTALYILDSIERKKYLQGTIITLPEDVEKMPKMFKTCVLGGRLVKCSELSKKVNRQKQMYDSRSRKWVKEGTPEYEAYKKYMDEKQAKIAASNERKIAQERKRLGIE